MGILVLLHETEPIDSAPPKKAGQSRLLASKFF
jgi:hypothetical protein